LAGIVAVLPQIGQEFPLMPRRNSFFSVPPVITKRKKCESDMTTEQTASTNSISSCESERPCAVDLLLVFVWFGLVAGISEVCAAFVLHSWRGHCMFFNENAIWMTPMAQMLLFVVLSLPVAAFALWCPRKTSLFATVGFCAFLASFCFLESLGSLHLMAVLLLAIGIAFQVGRFVDKRPQPFLGLIRRSVRWLIVVVLVAGIGLKGYRFAEETIANKRLPPARSSDPNVVLVVLDTVRTDALSVYGNPTAHTPNLERLARNAVVFDNALAPSSWTLPSHASMFTGQSANDLSADWYSPLDDRYPTLAEVMRDHGYATGGFVGNPTYCGRPTGLHRGFIHYEDCPLSIGELLRHSRIIARAAESSLGSSWFGIYDVIGRKGGKQVTDGFLKWIDHQRDRPFFAFLNYYDVHDPYLPDRLIDEDRALTHREKLLMKNWWRTEPEQIRPEDLHLAKACYSALIHEVDQHIGSLMAGLSERDLLNNTIIVVTSDHGEHFGEHDLYRHGNSLYRPLVHVPLMVSWPQKIENRLCVSNPVTLRDLPATILEWTGIENNARLGGISLAGLCTRDGQWEGRGTSPLFVLVNPNPNLDKIPHLLWSPVARGSMYSLLEDGKYLIRFGDNERCLYDFLTDIAEESNLASDDVHQVQLQQIERSLNRLLKGTTGAEGLAKGPEDRGQG